MPTGHVHAGVYYMLHGTVAIRLKGLLIVMYSIQLCAILKANAACSCPAQVVTSRIHITDYNSHMRGRMFWFKTICLDQCCRSVVDF